MNKCTVPRVVKEDIDNCKYSFALVIFDLDSLGTGVTELPGGHQAQYIKKRWVD
jgi:hypothetical protein